MATLLLDTSVILDHLNDRIMAIGYRSKVFRAFWIDVLLISHCEKEFCLLLRHFDRGNLAQGGA